MFRVGELGALGEGDDRLGFGVAQGWEQLCVDGPDGEDDEEQTDRREDEGHTGADPSHGRISQVCLLVKDLRCVCHYGRPRTWREVLLKRG